MATPLAGDGILALIPAASSSPATAAGPQTSNGSGIKNLSAIKSPILIFLFFQKAIRSELDRLHRAAMAFATDGSGDVRSLADRCRFLLEIYKHHCNAEDAVMILIYLVYRYLS